MAIEELFRDGKDGCYGLALGQTHVTRFVRRVGFGEHLDAQGLPPPDWQRFLADVVPRIIAVLNALPTATHADPATQLRTLIIGW